MRRWIVSVYFVVAASAFSQTVDTKLYEGMKWRQIGPFRGGRSIGCSGVYNKPNDFYMATCGGGLWKSEDAGQNWRCVTDGFLGVGTVGTVEVSRSNPDIVYIGTGEKDIRGNISHGDGLYKSTDAGKTWSRAGLEQTQTISRIVVHPKNPDIAWVAALGHVYGPNKERGIFKTVDGGKTWKNVLFESEIAGGEDLCIDPSNPEILYAATWEAWRNPYFLNSGGPGSKFWKSTDGGEHWTDITRNPGLPSGVIGKIGIAVSPVDPKRVWALVEAHGGGLFRSEDGGMTWKLLTDDHEYTQRAWYFSRVVADPKEADTVYVLNTGLFRSKDGGTKFQGIGSRHGDEHDLWIDPSDNKRMINSDDGGACVSVDGGKAWTDEDFPTGQFYHVSTDNATPYRILGAQQDNSTVRIASRTTGRGIGSADWTATAGGESGYVTPDPRDPDVVYGGNYGGDLSMINHRTGESRAVDPWPDNPMGHGAIDSKYRFQWTFPIVFSPDDPRVLYTCSQHVHRSTNNGASWEVISPDLTRNDRKTLGSSGGPITQDNTSVEYYATVFTVAESPKKRGVIWAGSDDGLVHVTQDNGKSWQDVTPKGAPKWGLCSMIDASQHGAGRAFLALDNHENDDYSPYAYRTDDFGKSWKLITTGLPTDTFVRVVREDPVREGLLYCGTETGLFVSFDGGDHWQPLKMNLPLVPVHDLVVKEDDLVLATHGRGFWVLDNLSSLRQMPGTSTGKAVLFKPKDATLSVGRVFGGRRGGGTASDEPLGDNPPTGIVVDYELPEGVKSVSFTLKDRDGLQVASSGTSSQNPGFNRTTVSNPRYPGYRGFPGMVLWAGRGGSIPAPPGTYTLTMTVDGVSFTQPLKLVKNPIGAASEADLVEQSNFARKIVARENEANDTVVKIRDIRKKLEEAVKSKPEFADQAKSLDAEMRPIEEAIYQTQSTSGEDPLNFPIRLNDKIAGVLGVVTSGSFGPTKQSYEVFDELSKQLQVQLDLFKGFLSKDLAAFNKKLKAAGGEEIVPVDPSKSASSSGRDAEPENESQGR